jgi:hypothetical protein
VARRRQPQPGAGMAWAHAGDMRPQRAAALGAAASGRVDRVPPATACGGVTRRRSSAHARTRPCGQVGSILINLGTVGHCGWPVWGPGLQETAGGWRRSAEHARCPRHVAAGRTGGRETGDGPPSLVLEPRRASAAAGKLGASHILQTVPPWARGGPWSTAWRGHGQRRRRRPAPAPVLSSRRAAERHEARPQPARRDAAGRGRQAARQPPARVAGRRRGLCRGQRRQLCVFRWAPRARRLGPLLPCLRRAGGSIGGTPPREAPPRVAPRYLRRGAVAGVGGHVANHGAYAAGQPAPWPLRHQPPPTPLPTHRPHVRRLRGPVAAVGHRLRPVCVQRGLRVAGAQGAGARPAVKRACMKKQRRA